jgi:hypothetical protein
MIDNEINKCVKCRKEFRVTARQRGISPFYCVDCEKKLYDRRK